MLWSRRADHLWYCHCPPCYDSSLLSILTFPTQARCNSLYITSLQKTHNSPRNLESEGKKVGSSSWINVNILYLGQEDVKHLRFSSYRILIHWKLESIFEAFKWKIFCGETFVGGNFKAGTLEEQASMKYERISDARDGEWNTVNVVKNTQFTDLKEYNLVLNQGM